MVVIELRTPLPATGHTMNQHTGSDFDDFLREEGILKEVTARAHKRLLSLQLAEAMEASNGKFASRIISLF